MKSSTKVWLVYSAVGLAISLVVIAIFDNFPAIRFFSNESVVFGIMFAQMGAAVRKASLVNADVNR